MNNNNNKIKILAPAGDFSCLIAAVQSKADSVYFGIEKLNMRSHSSNNFKIQKPIKKHINDYFTTTNIGNTNSKMFIDFQ